MALWLKSPSSVPRVQASANCRLEGTCACPPSLKSTCAPQCTRRQQRDRSVSSRLYNFSPCSPAVGLPDVHEQKKPWVPLMLEASYRPSGWLGIMYVPTACRVCLQLRLTPSQALRGGNCGGAHRLGSRLYFEFTATALSEGAAWEGLADGVAVEVRRHGAPPAVSIPQSAVAAAAAEGEAAPPAARVLAPAALAPPLRTPSPPPPRGVAAPTDVGVSSVVHVVHNTSVNNNPSNTTTINANFGNTTTSSIVLL